MTFYVCTVEEVRNLTMSCLTHYINTRSLRYFIDVIKRDRRNNRLIYNHVFYYLWKLK